jgi:hypothetical protein
MKRSLAMKKIKMIVPARLLVISMIGMGFSNTAHAASNSPSSNAVKRVLLKGAKAVAASHGTKIGLASKTKTISVTLSLKLRNAAQLKTFLKELYDPSSPNYKKFLTPAQFQAAYGPTQTQVQQVENFAKQNGLQVVSTNGTLMKISGTIGQMEKTFSTAINNYKDQKGHVYFANESTPKIPSTLSNIIVGISGLDNQARWHRSIAKRKASKYVAGKPENPHVGSGPAGGYTPTELREAYDISPIISAGYDGSGQNVALFELDGFVQSNISTYDSQYSLNSPTPSTILVDRLLMRSHQQQTFPFMRDQTPIKGFLIRTKKLLPMILLKSSAPLGDFVRKTAQLQK